MVLGVTLSLILRNIVDTTFFFVSMTMSLGLVTLVIWINPRINRYSVNLAILACFLGVVLTFLLVKDVSEFMLVIYAWGSCIAGLIIGWIIHLIRPAKSLMRPRQLYPLQN
jgi:hypothetical protein